MKVRAIAGTVAGLLIVGCAAVPAPSASGQGNAAAAAHAAGVAAIVASWEAAGGSRSSRPHNAVAAPSAVSAAWWGFNPVDSTDSLQAAIDSGASTVLIPRMEAPWTISRTLNLRSGGMRILLEPGVVLLAAKGAFADPGESMFTSEGGTDFSLVGYGATLRMRGPDYREAPYEPGQWRHAIRLKGVRRVEIAGLGIEQAGGDGVYVGTFDHLPCEQLTLRDLDIRGSHRQGISVISGRDVRIQQCRISDTWGNAPMAGIDFEPNSGDPGFTNCVVSSCWIGHNAGVGVLLALTRLGAAAEPVSIVVEDCVVDNLPIAVWLTGLQAGTRGTLTVVRCRIRGLSLLKSSSAFSVLSRDGP